MDILTFIEIKMNFNDRPVGPAAGSQRKSHWPVGPAAGSERVNREMRIMFFSLNQGSAFLIFCPFFDLYAHLYHKHL